MADKDAVVEIFPADKVNVNQYPVFIEKSFDK